MKNAELAEIFEKLRSLSDETEWVELKGNNFNPELIGEYISALSNSALLHDKDCGYLLFGVDDAKHEVIGINTSLKLRKVGNQDLEIWLATLLEPRIDFKIFEFEYLGKTVAFIQIEPPFGSPVSFKTIEFIRVGKSKSRLKDHPDKKRKIYEKISRDWSAGICEGASLSDLDPDAIKKARTEFKVKNPKLAAEVDTWDDTTFLNKAKVTIGGKISNTAILLLGRSEAEHFISPAVAKISWILKDEKNIEKDYEHFGPPFILNTDALLSKIRNLKYRYLPDNTLFPVEINQYDGYVIREALHNCIAHQDYKKRSRVVVVEKPEELIFSNSGSFLPGTVERVISEDAPQKFYRNQFLANAMVNLNMIDTIGGGIKKMFFVQRNRFFPLPSYQLAQGEDVTVSIAGRVLDENYTRLLMNTMDLDISTVMLLDRVQKRLPIEKDEFTRLKRVGLVSGRFPNIYVVSHIAAIAGDKAAFIKNKAFDKGYYKSLVIKFIDEYGTASRKEIDNLLLDKVSDVLSEDQKLNKIRNLLSEMSKEGMIKNTGSNRYPKWVLVK
jgi:ATP-dependent DNA helicase RecG